MSSDLEEHNLIAGAVAEVTRLHGFFGAWFRAEIEDSDACFQDFTGAMDEDFTIIGPDGEAVDREALMSGLRTLHGAHRDSHPPFHIDIKNPRGRHLGSGLCLVTYEEWQTADGKDSARIATAILRADGRAPGGLVWLNVHETWMN